MLSIFVLFWILLVWGLRDCDLYPKEAVVLAIIWCLLIAGFFVFPRASIGFIIGSVLIDVWILAKVLGQDIQV